jgi:hypothetical protein
MNEAETRAEPIQLANWERYLHDWAGATSLKKIALFDQIERFD